MLNKREIQYIQSNWEKYFDAPPFNYCDRLCEECRFTHCCSLYYDEKKWRLKVLREGKDPDDPKLALQYLGENFKKTFRMLEKEAKKHGIDFKELEFEDKDSPPPTHYKSSLSITANKWLKISLNIYRRLIEEESPSYHFFSLYPQLSKFEHYAFLVSSKIYRASLFFHEKDSNDKEEGYKDSVKSACLALCALRFCSNVIRSIAEIKVKDFGFECAEAIILGNKLEKQIKNKFPEVESYRSQIVFNSL